MPIVTIETLYGDVPGVAAAYLLLDGQDACFVETNTSRAIPALIQALYDAGRSEPDVRFVAITHIHLDHAGGAGAMMERCPGATLLAHPRAAPHAIDPARIVAGATEVYGAQRFAELYGEVTAIPAHRVRAMGDGERVPFGSSVLGFLHTRGHANHHTCVLWEDAVFTGDSFGIVYPALQRNGRFAFPSTSPTDFDEAAAHEAVDAIVGTGARRAFPTHFGVQTDLVGIASDLHRLLDAHGRLVEEADRSDLRGGALDAFCASGVRAIFDGELASHGLLGDATARELLALDVELNAQGLAFAVRKRQHKRGS